MTTSSAGQDRPIGVGAVGVLPGELDGLLAELPQGERFELAAFSDEGLPERGPQHRPAAYYPDYNMLLQDPKVELVLVDGPLELRRDMAVRALTAGRHVVLPLPFAETAIGAERIMKTALAGGGLTATADCPWRNDADLLALRTALEAEDVGPVQGLFFFTAFEVLPQEEDVLASIQMLDQEPEDEEEVVTGMLADEGVEVLDQMHIIAGDYVKSVDAHVIVPTPGGAEGFMIYMSLRGGGWAIGQATTHKPADLPRWVVYTPRATITVRDGRAVVTIGEETMTYNAPEQIEDFWDNLYHAVRSGAELKCSPVDIVRAMKLHEAALESVELGEAVTI